MVTQSSHVLKDLYPAGAESTPFQNSVSKVAGLQVYTRSLIYTKRGCFGWTLHTVLLVFKRVFSNLVTSAVCYVQSSPIKIEIEEHFFGGNS